MSDALLTLEDEEAVLRGAAQVHAALAGILYVERPRLVIRAEEVRGWGLVVVVVFMVVAGVGVGMAIHGGEGAHGDSPLHLRAIGSGSWGGQRAAALNMGSREGPLQIAACTQAPQHSCAQLP